MSKTILIIATIFTFISCGEKGWDEATKKQFISTCQLELTGQASSTSIDHYCNCALEKVILKYPHQEAAITSGERLHEIEDVKKCRTELIK